MTYFKNVHVRWSVDSKPWRVFVRLIFVIFISLERAKFISFCWCIAVFSLRLSEIVLQYLLPSIFAFMLLNVETVPENQLTCIVYIELHVCTLLFYSIFTSGYKILQEIIHQLDIYSNL